MFGFLVWLCLVYNGVITWVYKLVYCITWFIPWLWLIIWLIIWFALGVMAFWGNCTRQTWWVYERYRFNQEKLGALMGFIADLELIYSWFVADLWLIYDTLPMMVLLNWNMLWINNEKNRRYHRNAMGIGPIGCGKNGAMERVIDAHILVNCWVYGAWNYHWSIMNYNDEFISKWIDLNYIWTISLTEMNR